ncbi:MAG TPA: hypothetical protein PLN25_07510 [Deltaproteobacteria bacterium]|nr:hypothetical protein [Deltaproteobacteria bacterium]HQB39167.1 hypothetical protein [Deltaproteobacteria bacterium]
MRVIISVMLIVYMTFNAFPAHAVKVHHKYDTGIVSHIDSSAIVTNNARYKLRRDVKVIVLEKDSKGAFYRRKGSIYSVRFGNKVFLKVVGKTVYEIEVER